jgi:hypothetical protein
MGVARGPGLSALCVVVALLDMVGCDKGGATDTAALMSQNPAAICATKETTDGLRGAILGNLGLPTDPASKGYQSQLKSGTALALDLSVLDKFDKDIKKVSCSGKITVSWPANIVNRLKTQNSAVDWASDSASIEYAIQPSASGNGYVYTIEPPGAANIIGSARTMVATLVQADADAVAAAEAAKAAAQESANAANAAAREALATAAASPAAVASGATPTSGSTRYVCTASADFSNANTPASGAMFVTIDEARACVNNRTAYYRASNGGLARIMLVDADRRVSVVSVSPDRGTLLRQDFILPKQEYELARSRGQDLIMVGCPATAEASDVSEIQNRLFAAQQAIAPVVSSLLPARKMGWMCVPSGQ